MAAYKNNTFQFSGISFIVDKAAYIDDAPETSITQGQRPQRILQLEEDSMSASTIILEKMNLMQNSLPYQIWLE